MLNRSLKKKNTIIEKLKIEGESIANTLGVDLYQVKVKENIINNKSDGYFLTITSKTKETEELRTYFIDRFKRLYNKKLLFKNYCNSTFRGEECGLVTFYYRNNLFEKVI
jgi:hypothetical protein